MMAPHVAKKRPANQDATPSGLSPKKKRRRRNSTSKPPHQQTPEEAAAILQQRRQLPVYDARKKLIKCLKKKENAIIIGETGSGKTTQIPQFLYQAGLNQQKIIAVTQPRRVAAITIAERVSQERGTEIGKLVGYCVRFDDVTSNDTKIKYMTDGMLLREAILDPLLKRYSVVVLDEAHERTIHTDVLFGVVKAAQRRRKARGLPLLRILVMSATMDVDHFSQYFSNAPVIYLEGRQYPVELMYAKEPQTDYLFSSLVTAFQIHRRAPDKHDILIFLTGQEEIESMVRNIRDVAKFLEPGLPKLNVYPMYGTLQQGQQLKVFKPTPEGSRKIIVATNIAETSVTIPGIRYVIDSGMVKAKVYNALNGLDLLKECRVSQAQAWQRTGRAGRQDSGTCYRIYTEAEFQKFNSNTVPEIQRCNLGSVVLQLLAMGITDVEKFDFMDKPAAKTLESAFEELQLLGALEKDNNCKLTALGKQMAAFPLDPRLSKVLLVAAQHQCLEEVLTVVSILSGESILASPYAKRDKVQAVRQKFLSSEGDHTTLLNVFRAYKAVKGNKEWCSENFVLERHMRTALNVKRQLREICVRLGLPIQSCGKDTSVMRKCLCSGFFTNTAELQHDGMYVTMSAVKGRKKVHIHPSSALFKCKPAYVLYSELVMTSKCYMRNLCVIDADWLHEVAPHYFKTKKGKK